MQNLKDFVVFEDDHILVANKPSGLSSQPNTNGQVSFLESLSIKRELFLINRLDQRVSGLILFAKNEEAVKNLSNQLIKGEITKKYKAVVANKPSDDILELTHYLIKQKSKSIVVNLDTKGAKKCSLSFKTITSSQRYHLLEVGLETGRFHQIRTQLAAIGSPIVGDLKYGFPRSTPDGSIFLQSYYLEFQHPINLNKLNFELPMPEAWAKYGIS